VVFGITRLVSRYVSFASRGLRDGDRVRRSLRDAHACETPRATHAWRGLHGNAHCVSRDAQTPARWRQLDVCGFL